MRKGALTGAIVLGLLGVSMNVNAYHIIAGGGALPHGAPTVQGTWTLAPAGAVAAVCESNNFGGTGMPKEGNGGLCFMSPGCDATAGAAVPPGNGDLRSNGLLPDEVDGVVAVCGTAALINVPFSLTPPMNYVDLDMDEGIPATVAEVGWTANIIGFCAVAATAIFRYSENYAYWANDGHVAGFIGGMAPPLATGSYAVDDTGIPVAAGCAGTPEPVEDVFVKDIDY